MTKPTQIVRRRTRIRPGRRQRILIPQPDYRPYHLRARDVLRAEELRQESDAVIHRRGLTRPRVGDDPQEARAIPKSQLKGTLLERIVYKMLVEQFHFVAGVDFTFQSALEGGRQELGGIVADFLFEYHRIVLNPAGPTHLEFLRSRKDEEQSDILAEMGYTQYLIPQDMILNRPGELERFLSGIFLSSRGSAGEDLIDRVNETDLSVLTSELNTLYQSMSTLVNVL